MQRLVVAVDARIIGGDGGAEGSDKDRIATPERMADAVHSMRVAEVGDASAERCLWLARSHADGPGPSARGAGVCNFESTGVALRDVTAKMKPNNFISLSNVYIGPRYTHDTGPFGSQLTYSSSFLPSY